jgi:GntR family phosphonate transport system transcriptional regulator
MTDREGTLAHNSNITLTESDVRRGDGVAAWRQIADAIEADIRDGVLGPGERVATEAQLALRFGVNRHTIRRSIAALSQRGLVRATQGRGTFVEQRPLPYLIGARTRFTENIARTGHEAGGERLGSAVEPAGESLAARLQVEPDAAVLRIDFRRLVDGLPGSIGRTYFPLPRFRGLDEAYAASGSMSAAMAACGVSEYRRRTTIVGARAANSDEGARLELSPGRILFVVDSVNVDLDGVPVQSTVALFPADRFELRIEN